jgi:hypothetical protein
MTIAQGDPATGRFLALYGRAGRCIAAVSVDCGRWLPAYGALISEGATFPPEGTATDRTGPLEILAPGLA